MTDRVEGNFVICLEPSGEQVSVTAGEIANFFADEQRFSISFRLEKDGSHSVVLYGVEFMAP